MTEESGKLRIFISWSLPLSQFIAKIIKAWIPRVIQDVDPWVSSEDIEKGTYWQEAITNGLQNSTVGIIVVTPANSERPWLNFEAGALAKAIKLSGGIVAPVLFNMPGSSIDGPMNMLQVTRFDKAEILSLLGSINDRARSKLTQADLEAEFALKWDLLEQQVNDAIDADPQPVKPKTKGTDDLLEDILAGVRELRRVVEELRSRVESRNQNVGEQDSDFIREVLEEHGLSVIKISTTSTIDGTIHAIVVIAPEDDQQPVRDALALLSEVGSYEVSIQQATAARPNPKWATAGPPLILSIGDKVRHDKYGAGTVIDAAGTGVRATAAIDFGKAGKIRLMLIGGVPMVKVTDDVSHANADGSQRPS